MTSVRAVSATSKKEYKSRADSFPAMVLQSGLSQSLGFLLGKGGVYKAYADDVAKVIGHRNADDLHAAVIASPLPLYRRLTHEVLQAGVLLKRYGQIHLKEPPSVTEVSHARR